MQLLPFVKRFGCFAICILGWYSPTLAQSKPIEIQSVRIIDLETGIFSPPQTIKISQDKIESIHSPASKSLETKYYATPSFCDAYVTLGTQAHGGFSSPETVATDLKSYLFHGFHRIESVGDGPWVPKLLSSLASKKAFLPSVTQAEIPIAFPTPELASVSPKLYQVVSNWEEFASALEKRPPSRRIYALTKSANPLPISSTELFHLRKNAEARSQRIVFVSYEDDWLLKEAVLQQFEAVFHPWKDKNFKPNLIEGNWLWSPQFSLYRLRSGQFQKIHWEWLSQASPYFRSHYAERAKGLLLASRPSAEVPTETETSDTPPSSKEDEDLFVLRKYPELLERMVFSSGSGAQGVFPGAGAFFEIKTWEDNLPDSPKTRWGIFRSLGLTTCRYLGEDPSPRLMAGKPANFILYRQNPLEKKGGILDMETVVIQGKPISWKENQPTSPPSSKKASKIPNR